MTHHLLNNFKKSAVHFLSGKEIEQQQQLFHEILQVLSEPFVCSFLGVVPSLLALELFSSWLLKSIFHVNVVKNIPFCFSTWNVDGIFKAIKLE